MRRVTLVKLTAAAYIIEAAAAFRFIFVKFDNPQRQATAVCHRLRKSFQLETFQFKALSSFRIFMCSSAENCELFN